MFSQRLLFNSFESKLSIKAFHFKHFLTFFIKLPLRLSKLTIQRPNERLM